MDVVVAGGVSERYLRSTIELWDRLIQEFLLHLRNRPAMAEQEAAARAAAGDPAGASPVGLDHGRGRGHREVRIGAALRALLPPRAA